MKLTKKIVFGVLLILLLVSLSGCFYIFGRVPDLGRPVAENGTMPVAGSAQVSASIPGSCLDSAPTPLPTGFEARVIRVVDGDTLTYRDPRSQREVTARLVGINAPESVHPSKPVEAFGKEASAYLKELLDGKDIIIAPARTPQDKYGRALVWAWLPNGEFLTGRVVVDGYAQVYSFADNPDYADLLAQCQREAREARRGLWGAK